MGVNKPSAISLQSCRPPPWVDRLFQARPLLRTPATAMVNNTTQLFLGHKSGTRGHSDVCIMEQNVKARVKILLYNFFTTRTFYDQIFRVYLNHHKKLLKQFNYKKKTIWGKWINPKVWGRLHKSMNACMHGYTWHTHNLACFSGFPTLHSAFAWHMMLDSTNNVSHTYLQRTLQQVSLVGRVGGEHLRAEEVQLHQQRPALQLQPGVSGSPMLKQDPGKCIHHEILQNYVTSWTNVNKFL